MRLFLVRHGESIANRDGIYQGHMNFDLSDTGYKQADKIAKRLLKYNFNEIYASDLKRAYNTARSISKYHNIKIKKEARLREKDHGDFNGCRHKEKLYDFIEKEKHYIEKRAPNGENFDDLIQRVEEFLIEILEKYTKDENILIVSHGGTTKAIMTILMKYDPIVMIEEKLVPTPNTALFIVDINGNKKEIILNGCIKHLE